jgi:hypothetical protein
MCWTGPRPAARGQTPGPASPAIRARQARRDRRDQQDRRDRKGPGSGGVSSVTDFNGITCTTDGGADGAVTASTASDNTVTLTCGALSTDANCTHSNGVGENYTDCNDLLGDPTTGTGYDKTMADLAAQAFAHTFTIATVQDSTDQCHDAVSMVIAPTGVVVTWIYAPKLNIQLPNGVVAHAGEVHTEPVSDYTSNGNVPDCPGLSAASTDPTWN